MLLVDDREAEPRELDPFLHERMRADRDLRFARRNGRQGLLFFCGRSLLQSFGPTLERRLQRCENTSTETVLLLVPQLKMLLRIQSYRGLKLSLLKRMLQGEVVVLSNQGKKSGSEVTLK